MFVLYTRPNTKSSIFLQFFRIFLQSFFDFIYFYAILCKYSLLFTLFMHNMDFGAELCIFCSVLPFPFVYIFKNIQINVDYMQHKFGLSQKRNNVESVSKTECQRAVANASPYRIISFICRAGARLCRLFCTNHRLRCRGEQCSPAPSAQID